MVQAKMPFLLLYMYPDWSLTPFIVFCSDKNIINVIYFIFLILIFFFRHRNILGFFSTKRSRRESRHYDTRGNK